MYKAEYLFHHPTKGSKWMDIWPGNIYVMGTHDFCLQTLKDMGGLVSIDGIPVETRIVEDMSFNTSSRNSNNNAESSSR